jgi:hypothetical protein
MFKPEFINERVKAQPFRPLRIIASEGLHYDIYHPDLIMVGERDITIGLSRRQGTIYDRQIRVALIHIVALEEIPPAPLVDTTTDA